MLKTILNKVLRSLPSWKERISGAPAAILKAAEWVRKNGKSVIR